MTTTAPNTDKTPDAACATSAGPRASGGTAPCRAAGRSPRMADSVIVTVHYIPPGASDTDSLRLELHAEPGARLTVHLGAHRPPAPASADIPAQPQPASPASHPLPQDSDLPGLPADCAPGTRPALLTDTQAHARIRYGLSQGWTQRRIGEFAGRKLALVCVPEDEEGNWSVGEITVSAGREPSADDKILAVLADHADPLALEVIYLHKDAIGEAAGLEGSTLNNALTRLVKADKIHRQKKDGKEVRGMYGPGPEPITG
ncbi:hypothetical protein OHB41_51430 [Streptomyces sp. NBC_01571]|uniref:hypothetical protein n=1 Tax=Streptomyces sp. NBC_01571 TaxID=2975883 RepID=UPI002255F1D6|nr:hypothetical protein [Streptomyces sp. NBC_01571]MCX4581372.1 hypothetical protein [Streptomyces sp. NBC_01571]